jgi:hypothetical protein
MSDFDGVILRNNAQLLVSLFALDFVSIFENSIRSHHPNATTTVRDTPKSQPILRLFDRRISPKNAVYIK